MSGLATTSLDRTVGSDCYARFATLAAVTIVLILFTTALRTLFSSLLETVVWVRGENRPGN